MRRYKICRFLRRELCTIGLPTTLRMWALLLGLALLGGLFAAYITSDDFRLASAQAAARQYLYNRTGQDFPLAVENGNFKEGFSFSVPYEKIEADGTVSRRGVFSGRGWPDGRLEGTTQEDFSRYGDRGERNVSTRPDGTVQIRVRH